MAIKLEKINVNPGEQILVTFNGSVELSLSVRWETGKDHPTVSGPFNCNRCCLCGNLLPTDGVFLGNDICLDCERQSIFDGDDIVEERHEQERKTPFERATDEILQSPFSIHD